MTNTTRPKSITRLAASGIEWVMTTTPELDGVSSGTNLMEAMLVALIGKPVAEIMAADYEEWIGRLGWQGSFQTLNPEASCAVQ